MIQKHGFLKIFLAIVFSVSILYAEPVLPADGSGTNEAVPTSVIAGSTGNTLTFTYTASEVMKDGGIKITAPAGWSAPQGTPGVAGFTEVSATNGMIADVIDQMGHTNWEDDSLLGYLENVGHTYYENEDEDSTTKSGASLHVNEFLSLLVRSEFYYNYSSAQNWSGYTTMGFWIRSSQLLALGGVQLWISESADLPNNATTVKYNLPTISANTWTYVTIDLTGEASSTRDQVLSYGFSLPPLGVVVDYYFDNIQLGPGTPTFSGQTVKTNLVQLDNAGTVTVTYGSGGGASGVAAPTTAGVYTFTTTQRVDSGGTYTALGTSPSVTIYPDTAAYLKVTGTATMTAGNNNELTVRAYDQYDNLCDSGPNNYNGSKDLTFSGPGNAPDGMIPTVEGTNIGSATTVNFTNGASDAAAATLIAYRAETTTVDADDGTINSDGDPSYDLDLTVNTDSANKLAFTVQPSNTTATEAIAPAVTVTVQDQYGNTITSDNSTDITLGIGTNPGSGTLSGTLTQTASSGIATFNDLSINKAGTGYTLTASSNPSYTGDTSDLFNITAGTLDHIVIEDAAGGTGSPVDTHSMSSDDTYTLYAIGYDSENNYTGDVSVTWSWTSGDFDTDDLSTTSATSTIFQPDNTGTGVLHAASGALSDDTGTLTVTAGTLGKIVFTTPTQTLTAGSVSDIMTIQTQDSESNPTNVNRDTVIHLTSTSANGTFYSDAECANEITFVTIINGSNSASFYYRDTAAGTPTITAAESPSRGWTNATQKGTINAVSLHVSKDANKKEATVGDIVTYTITISNNGSSDVDSVFLEDMIPAGFKYLDGKVTLNGSKTSNPSGKRPLIFDIGTISAESQKTLKYQMIVGSGVSPGDYKNIAFARFSDGTIISNRSSETVKIIFDVLFDLGTVIGKVFWDSNENGVQDKGEEGVGGAEIATEEGILITTDMNGKYHLPAVIPGRHLLKIDKRSLPQGSYLVTRESVIIDVTSGLLTKVNFGINSKHKKGGSAGSGVTIIQKREKPDPRLNVGLFVNETASENPELIKRAEFLIVTNYSFFINKWELEILDKDTKKIIRIFTGTRQDIFDPIFWDGRDNKGRPLGDWHNYVYVLRVIDKSGRKDVTKERTLVIKEDDTGIQKTEEEIIARRRAWLIKEDNVDNLIQQNIKVEGETVSVSIPYYSGIVTVKEGEEVKGKLYLNSGQKAASQILKLHEKSESIQTDTKVDIILPDGNYDIEVAPIDTEIDSNTIIRENGPLNSSLPCTKHVKIGDNYLFLTALGDAKIGHTSHSGHTGPIQDDDKFNQGFWHEGRLAYYLKSKVKKYLITASLDTERDRKELFRDLDPDKYYPVYGDSSKIQYDADDTQGMFYALVEWDKSSVLWGNYHTGLTDTEFATFSRTLYGGKLDYQSTFNTQFSEPNTKLVAFGAKAQQRAAHNEFSGTGGSLFYLKHKDVIEGSQQVKVEVRDKITGLVLSSKDMENGSDYEIDYSNGRITFWQPVSFITDTASIVSGALLEGNPVYVVVEYEYQVKDAYNEPTYGMRLQQSLTDYLRLGGTYVHEKQLDQDYELKEGDITVHVGKNIKLTGEYAESESEEAGSFVSTDGGLTFTQLSTADTGKGKAYGIKAEAYIWGRMGISSYYKKIEKGFSSSSTVSQQGKELAGASMTLDITSQTRLKLVHDTQKLIDNGNPQNQLQVGAEKTETTSAQINHQVKKLKLVGEYQHQKVDNRLEQFQSETNTDGDTIAVGGEYQATNDLNLSLRQQATLKGASNHQTAVGVTTKFSETITLRIKEVVGSNGTGTLVGASMKSDDKTEQTVTWATDNSSGNGTVSSFGVGSKRKINDSVEATYNRQVSRDKESVSNVNIFGLSGDINNKWRMDARFERGEIQNHDGVRYKRNALSMGLDHTNKDSETHQEKFKVSSKLELRLDDGQENKRQFLLCNAIEKKLNPDTTLFVKLNYSRSENTTTDVTEAEYKEFVSGLAYRPIDFDKLNLLAKYTRLEEDSSSSQSDINDTEKEKSHVFATEAIYDLTDKWQTVGKIAVKYGKEKVAGFDFTKTQTWLGLIRINYNLFEDWQAGIEYRRLTQKQADDVKQGFLFEVAKDIGEHTQVGVGYNFTDFNDNLTHLDYTSQGPFIRFTVKF